MTPADFHIVAKEVYINLAHINRYLGKAKISSKLLPTDTSSIDLPGALLALAKETDTKITIESNNTDSAERPSAEDIDTLFDTIRTRSSTTGSNNNKQHRQGSVKKTAPTPLQQSRLLNETNLLSNTNVPALTNSCSDLTKQSAIDEDALVDRLRQAICMLGSIENGNILSIDLGVLHQQFRREWSSIAKACRNVESLLEKFQKQKAEDDGPNTVKKEPLIGIELVNAMKQLQTKLHYTVLVKKSEVMPDLTKTLSHEVFPLSECLDMIDETISQKQL
uniref:Uncharacterized protein n=1 Tax=Anopheles farauti TaxID=69004 RepID=A0A182QPI9_9DIPT